MEDTFEIFNPPDFLSKAYEKVIHDVQAKKYELIFERINKLGNKYTFDDFKNSRFKRLICERHPDCEIWYYDNGTNEGQKIITFYPETNTDEMNKQFMINYGFKYI